MRSRIVYMILLGVLGTFLVSTPVPAAEQRVIIAVTSADDAMHPVIEEAFFQTNPGTEIVYALYPADQLRTAILTGKVDFDLLIQPIEQINAYGESGFLESLYPAMGIAQWPENLLDIRQQIERNGSLYGIPTAVYQNVWSWHDALAQLAGVDKPAVPWDWSDYETLSNRLPMDMNMDGAQDVYLMYGTKTQDTALSNVQLDPLYDYFSAYPGDFASALFSRQLSVFERIVKSPSLLPMDDPFPPMFQGSTAVLISNHGMISPLGLLGNDDGEASFLPPPVIDAEHVFYLGGAKACAMVKSAPRREAALAFLHTMLSSEAADAAYGGNDMVDLVYRQMPSALWSDIYGVFQPSFEEGSGNLYVVPRARNFQIEDFPYTEEQFDAAQNFRNKLKIPALSVGRPFYDAVVNRLARWINGTLSLEAAVKSVQEVYTTITME